MISLKNVVAGFALIALSPIALASSTTYPYGGKFIADAGKSNVMTKRAGCGAIKERPYYHEIQLNPESTFIERIYITGIEEPDLELTGEWHEEKKRIYLSYDGAINEGSAGSNTGWAPLLGDIETQLAGKCRMAGISLINPVTDMRAHSLVINSSGTKAKITMKFKGKSQGGYTKPKSTKRSVVSTGRFERSSR